MHRPALAATLTAAVLAGCTTGARVVTPATPEQQALLLDQIKPLEGVWEITDEQGNPQTASIFKVSSSGSVVREIMFPDTPHEMTNVYHMDGGSLILTHYCAVGNQPRMRAVAGEPGRIVFKFDDVTNHTAPNEVVMGEMTLTIHDADHITQHWVHTVNGKPGEPAVFSLTRRK